MSSAQKVLLTLADLAPSAEGRTTGAAIPTEWFRWLPLEALRLFLPPAEGSSRLQTIRRVPVATDLREIYVPIDRRLGERLAAVDQLRPRAGPSGPTGKAAAVRAFRGRGGGPSGDAADPGDGGPDDLMRQEGLVIVAGTGVYAVHETGGGPTGGRPVRAYLDQADVRPARPGRRGR